jgi:hypothetical protein
MWFACLDGEGDVRGVLCLIAGWWTSEWGIRFGAGVRALEEWRAFLSKL